LTPNDDRNLILISVLPELEGNSDWVEINVDSIEKDIVTPSHLIKLFRLHTFTGLDETHSTKTKYFDEYQIIKKLTPNIMSLSIAYCIFLLSETDLLCFRTYMER